MAKANIAHLAVQATSVLKIELEPLPPLPFGVARVPGMVAWYNELQGRRQMEKENIQRALLVRDSTLISLSPSPQPVMTPTRRTARQPCTPSTPPEPVTPPTTIFVLDLLYLRNQDTGNYCPLTIVGPQDAQQIYFDNEVPFPGPPDDIIADLIYLKNTDTGLYCPLTLSGDVGVQQIQFGTEVVLSDATTSILVNVIYFKNQTTGLYCTVTLDGNPLFPQLQFGAEITP